MKPNSRSRNKEISRTCIRRPGFSAAEIQISVCRCVGGAASKPSPGGEGGPKGRMRCYRRTNSPKFYGYEMLYAHLISQKSVPKCRFLTASPPGEALGRSRAIAANSTINRNLALRGAMAAAGKGMEKVPRGIKNKYSPRKRQIMTKIPVNAKCNREKLWKMTESLVRI